MEYVPNATFILRLSLQGFQSNVYINDQGHAMLGDFGLTTVADLKSATTTINRAGAIRWMSPEVDCLSMDRMGHNLMFVIIVAIK
jgi:hypothetical protein